MTTGAFPRDEHLTTIAIAYKNPDAALIADVVSPRKPVTHKSFKWYKYPLEQGFNVPNTFIGERGAAKMVELSGVSQDGSVEDYAIKIPLTSADIKDAPKGTDPRGRATEVATNLIVLDREVRLASKLFNAASWPATNKVDVDAPNKFSAATGNPIKYIQERLDSCAMRPNVMVFGQAAWTSFKYHPEVVKAALGTNGGAVLRERIAELLEVTEVLVGAGWVNSVKPGKTPVLSRVWGGHALGFYRDRSADVMSGGITSFLTAQHGTRVAGSREVEMGVDGGTVVQVGEKLTDLIVADRAAFYFENAA